MGASRRPSATNQSAKWTKHISSPSCPRLSRTTRDRISSPTWEGMARIFSPILPRPTPRISLVMRWELAFTLAWLSEEYWWRRPLPLMLSSDSEHLEVRFFCGEGLTVSSSSHSGWYDAVLVCTSFPDKKIVSETKKIENTKKKKKKKK